jgi:hypothetical protein
MSASSLCPDADVLANGTGCPSAIDRMRTADRCSGPVYAGAGGSTTAERPAREHRRRRDILPPPDDPLDDWLVNQSAAPQ